MYGRILPHRYLWSCSLSVRRPTLTPVGTSTRSAGLKYAAEAPPSTVPGQLAFPKGHEADAAAMLKAESAANSYLVNSVYLCGGRTVDPRCGK